MTDALDVDGFIDEDFKSVDATRYQQSGGRDDKGRWVNNDGSGAPYDINLQPLTEKELINLGAGGERVEDFRKVFINNGDLHSLTPQDEWEFNTPALVGFRFSTFKMDNRPWRNYCKIIVTRNGDQIHTVVNGANFDSLNDYLTKTPDFAGSVDSKVGTVAMRVRVNSNTGTDQHFIMDNGQNFDVRITGLRINIYAENVANTPILNISSSFIAPPTDYINILLSWDLSIPVARIYIDDVSDLDVTTTLTDDIINYTNTIRSVGGTTGGVQNLDGDFNFLWLDQARYFDFDIESERRKFFTVAGLPVLSAIGNGAVDSVQPILYNAGFYNQWGNNKGTGGGMVVNGALTEPVD